MASSLQAFVGSTANGLVAGVVAPLVMHSALALAATSLAMMSIGVVAWLVGQAAHASGRGAAGWRSRTRSAGAAAARPAFRATIRPCSCSSSAW